MPKESFEQFVKRQEEKLERAKRMIEGVKEKCEKEKERFIEKSVDELKRVWKENEKEVLDKMDFKMASSFFLSLPLPEVPPSFLEKISNKFLKEFDWKGFKEKISFEEELSFPSLFLSAFLKKNVENYILSQKKKGIKEEKIKPIELHLDVKELPFPLDCLGYQNPRKLHLIIEGNVGNGIGLEMEGGEIVVKGDCKNYTGKKKKDGKIIVEGNCDSWTGEEMNGGEIIVKGNCGWCTGEDMKDGKIIVEGNCGSYTGGKMKGGELNLKGKVESFDESAFSPSNKGTIILKNVKIWENGHWTKEGEKMR